MDKLATWQELKNCHFDLQLSTTLPSGHLLEAQNAIELWLKNRPLSADQRPENTGVQQMFGIPSLVISIDCAPNHALNILDIEGGAGGLGLAQLINDPLSRRLEQIRRGWPEIKFFASDSMAAKHDYDLWLEGACAPDVAKQADLLFIISAPGELPGYGHLSAAPLLTRGDKTYGEGWLWDNVGFDQFEALFFRCQSGFCLKSQHSRHMKDLYIFHPHRCLLDRRGIHGASTRSQIFRALRQHEVMYCQPFQEAVFALGDMPTVHRIFFLFDVKSKEYVYAGGLLISRPSLKTCSVYNATFGVVN
ncbi:MAG: hypothetical protein WC453_00045 [Patescibacteria group bacterium]